MKTGLLNILFWSVISAAFIGPGTVTTAARAGADFGLPLLWALTFATLACMVLQEAAARLAIASEMDLGQAIRFLYSNTRRKTLIPVLVAVCILSGTAAYQTGNLLGAMSGISLLTSAPAWLLVLVLGLGAGLLLLVPSVKMIARILGGMVGIMGIAFLVSAIAIQPPLNGIIRGIIRPIIPLEGGGGLLVLGLIGTTVVPYNLFLGSGISKGQSLKEMRYGLLTAVLLGGIISMAVLVTGSSVTGTFSFGELADALDRHIGMAGTLILGVGLLAAGFTSAVTAPLASAVTVRSLFGDKGTDRWKDGSARFRLVWISVLVTGVIFGMAGFRPVPAIIMAQALNGLILPFIAVFLLIAVNNRGIMRTNHNNLAGNILMTAIVFVTMIIGLTGLVRAVLSGFHLQVGNWNIIMLAMVIISFSIVGSVLLRIYHGKKSL